MDPRAVPILEFISAAKRTFIIPVYQRNYSWRKEHCEKLFEDIIEAAQKDKKHYFGNVVYYALSTDFAAAFSEFALIDGQQRITTIMLLLAALRDTVADENQRQSIEENYLINKNNGSYRVKLKQIEGDRDVYDSIISGTLDDEAETNASRNYKFFKKLIIDSKEEANTILKGINNLIIVALDLKLKEQGYFAESPQVIFESINGTGEPLSSTDLIRNYLLMGVDEQKQESFYKDYWTAVERNCGDSRAVESFVHQYLVMKIKDDVRSGAEYKVLKRRIEEFFPDSEHPCEDILKELCLYSKYYGWIRTPALIREKSQRAYETLIHLGEIGIENAIPFLLELLKRVDDINTEYSCEDFATTAEYLENWLFRARVTRNISTPKISEILISLPGILKNTEDNQISDKLLYELSNYRTQDIWPDDESFKKAFVTFDFFNNRFFKNYVLQKLENDHGEKNKPGSIEHVMPQTLTEYWKNVINDENYMQLHAEYLNTIGNLAPMNLSDNIINSNDDFSNKKVGLSKSSWAITREIAEYPEWNINTIKDRAEKLSEMATTIWGRPLKRERPIEANVLHGKNKERAAPIDFLRINIPIGAELIFSNTAYPSLVGTKCYVASARTVTFNGEKMSITRAAKTIMKKDRKDTIAGPDHFKYNGKWLNDIRREYGELNW